MRAKRLPLRPGTAAPKVGVARALSKLAFCSRREAFDLVRAGRVKVNGRPARDPEQPTDWQRDRIEVDGARVPPPSRVYLMLNKPRGLVTTASDERGRATVYACLADAKLPFLSPVGRLDQASEGLLLFTNDTAWAARLTDPASRIEKTYHVQIDRVPDEALLTRLRAGGTDAVERLTVRRVAVLRHGQRNGWLEMVLDEGRNRHIRRLLAALGVEVLRLVRVSIGALQLGDLPKGAWRLLSEAERRALDAN